MDFQPRRKSKDDPKPPRKYSLKEFKLSKGTIIGAFWSKYTLGL